MRVDTKIFEEAADSFNSLAGYAESFSGKNLKLIGATADQILATQYYWNGVLKYFNEFNMPFWIALNSFNAVEKDKLTGTQPWETARDYIELMQFNYQVAEKGFNGSLEAMNNYHRGQLNKAFAAWFNTIFNIDGDDFADVAAGQAKLIENVVATYPQAIRDIKPEFGFHFEEDGYVKMAETERFSLYQVLPTDKKVRVRENGKPIVIIPPYVLGPNILCFLPHENKSYVHGFANQGTPTYIRIMKNIDVTSAVQAMTGEDDARDTRYFCEQVKTEHGRAVTLNGFCQGGFIAVTNLLSGELDGLVDALITCVAPIDGTRSKSLVEYLNHLPPRFRDLGYAVKTLPNGNRVVDGTVMSWVYKLKSMEKEAPLFSFFRDLIMFDRSNNDDMKISKTAAAINHWLVYDRSDLPEAITKMSFDSYTVPVEKDGTLPIKLFDRKLNFKRIKEKAIKFLICYAEKDDLVDKETALAPLDYIDAEVTAFPKGHGAIATSWSNPESACALHTRFGDQNCRGPVRFQLDLDRETDKSVSPRPKKKAAPKSVKG
ncbi:MAG: metal transporter [Desulfosarcina sp.]|nr:metal transporter [Desulfosarcina sp.]MBC2742165.1 metal transporter [Desulfosarcina sp.]MBC2765077.1 metal transporter [Desulfosarcina sp.]